MLLSSYLSSINSELGNAEQTAITAFVSMSEKNDYSGCAFSLGSKRIVYREAKVTPKKIGLFVAIWKRNELGVSMPYHVDDEFDYMAIGVRTSSCKGYFLYPKEALVNLGIISSETKEGKRGMRVYPKLKEGMNKQALKTYQSQAEFYYIL